MSTGRMFTHGKMEEEEEEEEGFLPETVQSSSASESWTILGVNVQNYKNKIKKFRLDFFWLINFENFYKSAKYDLQLAEVEMGRQQFFLHVCITIELPILQLRKIRIFLLPRWWKPILSPSCKTFLMIPQHFLVKPKEKGSLSLKLDVEGSGGEWYIVPLTTVPTTIFSYSRMEEIVFSNNFSKVSRLSVAGSSSLRPLYHTEGRSALLIKMAETRPEKQNRWMCQSKSMTTKPEEKPNMTDED